MMKRARWPKRWYKQIVALVIVSLLYWATRLPVVSAREKVALTARFQFQRMTLPRVAGYEMHNVRPVNPRLAKISAWISTVGAAVALSDLDGDGLPNDLCYVDTRTDKVTVATVPGTPNRYAPFVLDAAPLPYDPATMAPMGCLPVDVNEDGLTDIVVYYWGRSPVVFLQREIPQQKGLVRASFVARALRRR